MGNWPDLEGNECGEGRGLGHLLLTVGGTEEGWGVERWKFVEGEEWILWTGWTAFLWY